jgi:hypothetical protein
LNGPAIRPFSSTICSGSASETLRVRLLSGPQATQALTMASGPSRFDKVGRPDQERIAAPATRQAMPMAIRRSKFSWKTNHAISAVATPSSVSISEAVAASVRESPNISSSGPMMPPTAMAPASQGSSARLSAASDAPRSAVIDRITRRSSAAPSPAPQ